MNEPKSFYRSCKKNNPALILAICLLILFAGCKKQIDNSSLPLPPPPPRVDKPNIILILGDDVGYEIPSCNGGQSYNTPNIDNMAIEGMRFTQCHSTPL